MIDSSFEQRERKLYTRKVCLYMNSCYIIRRKVINTNDKNCLKRILPLRNMANFVVTNLKIKTSTTTATRTNKRRNVEWQLFVELNSKAEKKEELNGLVWHLLNISRHDMTWHDMSRPVDGAVIYAHVRLLNVCVCVYLFLY